MDNEIKFENICKKYPIISRLNEERVFTLKLYEDEPILYIEENCDNYFYELLNSKDCEEISKCFLKISKLLKEMEERK